MGGTSEREPPERDQAHRHLHAVPPAENPGTGPTPTAGTTPGGPGAEQGTTAASDNGSAPQASAPQASAPQASAPQASAPQATPSAAGTYATANGTPAPVAGAGGVRSALMIPPARRILAAVGLYAVLFVFGLLLGLTGAFQFSRSIGPVPLGAVCFVLAIGAACWLCGRATRSVGGALAAALGWIIASFSMALPSTGGSIVITNSLAGEIYLYGGALCAAIGVGAAFGGWTRAQQAGGPAGSPGTRRPPQ